ncbi:MAG TPA: hypothetical protein VFE45_19030 [Coriobacteriia bacterium]|nr:hypothetical protein [Coriobacteriia bacterium]
MTTTRSIPQTRTLSTATTWLGWTFVALWTAAAVLVPVLDRANAEPAGSIGNLSAAALVAAGLLTFERIGLWLGLSLITLGALIGGVFLIYLIVPMIVAIALIVLAARDAFGHPTS